MPKVKDISITHPDGTVEILDLDALEQGWTENVESAINCFFEHISSMMKRMDYDVKAAMDFVKTCIDDHNLSDDELTSFENGAIWILNNKISASARQSPLSQHIAP